MNAIIISGLLTNLNDSIIPIIKDNDIYVHTWNTLENERWIQKLNRYKKYCNNLFVEVEDIKFQTKLYSYFYSTYKAVNLIKDIDRYNIVIKLKPDQDTNHIPFTGNLSDYFSKAKLTSRPLLDTVKKEECVYGIHYYVSIDERIFSGYPLAFKKLFHILYNDFESEMTKCNKELIKQHGNDYEGSLFWTKWIESRGLKIIQDLDLKLVNNKM